MIRYWAAAVLVALIAAACGSGGDTDLSANATSASDDVSVESDPQAANDAQRESDSVDPSGEQASADESPDAAAETADDDGATDVSTPPADPAETPTPQTDPTATPAPEQPSATPVPTEPAATATPAPTAEPDPTATPDPWGPTPTPAPVDVSDGHPVSGGVACVLQLHGNAGTGIDPDTFYDGPYFAGGAITLLQPISPDSTDTDTWWEFDGPYEVYSDSEEFYLGLRDFLRNHVDAFECGPIFVWGVSAGAAMAIELYCNGEDFGGRVWAYYFADPAMGASVRGCTPPPYSGMRTWLIQSDEVIDQAVSFVQNDNSSCGSGPTGYYCEDGIALSPDEYYAELGIGPDAIVETHLQALFGEDQATDAWTNIEAWYAEYDPSRF